MNLNRKMGTLPKSVRIFPGKFRNAQILPKPFFIFFNGESRGRIHAYSFFCMSLFLHFSLKEQNTRQTNFNSIP